MKLYNGVEIPAIGFGPGVMNYAPVARRRSDSAFWRTIPGRAVDKFIRNPLCKAECLYEEKVIAPRKKAEYVAAVANGLRAGFRLIDYSMAYGGGENIAEAIALSGVKRSDVFLTGRVSNAAQFGGVRGVREEIDRMLNEYRTDYVDLLMIHWPVTEHFEDTWRELCKAYEAGKARSVGVANCHPHHLEKLMNCGLKPMVNQFEIHPLFTQKDLVKYNQDLGIVVEAYTSIARFDDRLMRLPALKKIAADHGKSSVQVVLRWHIQNGCIPVIRSLNPLRQKANLEVFDFDLSAEEMRIIDGFNINSRLRYDPDNCDFTIL